MGNNDAAPARRLQVRVTVAAWPRSTSFFDCPASAGRPRCGVQQCLRSPRPRAGSNKNGPRQRSRTPPAAVNGMGTSTFARVSRGYSKSCQTNTFALNRAHACSRGLRDSSAQQTRLLYRSARKPRFGTLRTLRNQTPPVSKAAAIRFECSSPSTVRARGAGSHRTAHCGGGHAHHRSPQARREPSSHRRVPRKYGAAADGRETGGARADGRRAQPAPPAVAGRREARGRRRGRGPPQRHAREDGPRAVERAGARRPRGRNARVLQALGRQRAPRRRREGAQRRRGLHLGRGRQHGVRWQHHPARSLKARKTPVAPPPPPAADVDAVLSFLTPAQRQRFVDNEVTLECLALLNDEDLDDLLEGDRRGQGELPAALPPP